jgi:hypothetical protein
MLVKRISQEDNREQIVYSLLISVDDKTTHLIVGRKRQIDLYQLDIDQFSKNESNTPPSAIDSCEFAEDIIELRSFAQDLLVVLDNLEIYYVDISSGRMIKHYAGIIRPLADTPVTRIKYTSLAVSSLNDIGLLSVFSNSLVALYISHTKEDSKINDESTNPSHKKMQIESSYKYYDFQVNSSLLITSHGEEGEFIWHLDEDHNLVRSPIVRSNSVVEIISEEENILYTDKSIIDVNYFNSDHIALLLLGGVQFFNTKELGVTTKIETHGVTLINILPLYEGAFEDIIRMVGVTSKGECLKYTVEHNKGYLGVKQIEPLADNQT